MTAELLQIAADPGHASADGPTVGFQLGLAGATRADAAPQSREIGSPTNRAGEQVVELGQFNLELAFPRLRALGEDIEDQRGAIDGLAPRQLFEAPLLRS